MGRLRGELDDGEARISGTAFFGIGFDATLADVTLELENGSQTYTIPRRLFEGNPLTGEFEAALENFEGELSVND